MNDEIAGYRGVYRGTNDANDLGWPQDTSGAEIAMREFVMFGVAYFIRGSAW